MRAIQYKKRKKILAISIAFVVLVTGSLLLWTRFHQVPAQSPSASSASDSSAIDKQGVATSTSSKDVDVTKDTNQIPTSTDTTITIDSLRQENGQVIYSASISGSGGGTCAALFSSRSGKPVNDTAAATGTTCQGRISDVEFDMVGSWTLTLRYYVGDHQSVATKDIVIR